MKNVKNDKRNIINEINELEKTIEELEKNQIKSELVSTFLNGDKEKQELLMENTLNISFLRGKIAYLVLSLLENQTISSSGEKELNASIISKLKENVTAFRTQLQWSRESLQSCTESIKRVAKISEKGFEIFVKEFEGLIGDSDCLWGDFKKVKESVIGLDAKSSLLNEKTGSEKKQIKEVNSTDAEPNA